jgi:hypothetical protein
MKISRHRTSLRVRPLFGYMYEFSYTLCTDPATRIHYECITKSVDDAKNATHLDPVPSCKESNGVRMRERMRVAFNRSAGSRRTSCIDPTSWFHSEQNSRPSSCDALPRSSRRTPLSSVLWNNVSCGRRGRRSSPGGREAARARSG